MEDQQKRRQIRRWKKSKISDRISSLGGVHMPLLQEAEIPTQFSIIKQV
jgi:hypothetical protein